MSETIETVIRRRTGDGHDQRRRRYLRARRRHRRRHRGIEAARLGRRVLLVDAAPALGGQAVGSIIGTIIGLYSHGRDAYQITHGLADELIRELTATGALSRRHSTRTGTVTFQYDVVPFGRWVEQKVQDAGVRTLIGATLTDAAFDERRLRHLTFATRSGRFASTPRATSTRPATRC